MIAEPNNMPISIPGIYGYSAYGASKWAVRGLAEAINMEAIGTNVQVTVAFPPDTETPGFEKEELTKPTVTKLISGSGGLWKPDDVGKKIVHDAMVRLFYSYLHKFAENKYKNNIVGIFTQKLLFSGWQAVLNFWQHRKDVRNSELQWHFFNLASFDPVCVHGRATIYHGICLDQFLCHY